TANARYLLGIAGMVYVGDELGTVSFDFTYASIITLPTATLNLVLGPPLARAIAGPSQERARTLAVRYVSLDVLSSVAAAAFALLTYRYAIAFVDIPWAGDYELFALLAASAVVGGATNGLIIISQFQGRAMKTARIFSAILALKLLI